LTSARNLGAVNWVAMCAAPAMWRRRLRNRVTKPQPAALILRPTQVSRTNSLFFADSCANKNEPELI